MIEDLFGKAIEAARTSLGCTSRIAQLFVCGRSVNRFFRRSGRDAAHKAHRMFEDRDLVLSGFTRPANFIYRWSNETCMGEKTGSERCVLAVSGGNNGNERVEA
jgi:hypothetical protein